jgi:hypothetical protein
MKGFKWPFSEVERVVPNALSGRRLSDVGPDLGRGLGGRAVTPLTAEARAFVAAMARNGVRALPSMSELSPYVRTGVLRTSRSLSIS